MPNLATWLREKDEKWFQPFFDKHPEIQVHNACIGDATIDAAGGLLLTGGSDISLGGALPGWFLHGAKWAVICVFSHASNLLNQRHGGFVALAEDGVIAVQRGIGHFSDKKLRSVGIRPRSSANEP